MKLERFHQQTWRTQMQMVNYYLSTFVLWSVITLSVALLVDYIFELGLRAERWQLVLSVNDQQVDVVPFLSGVFLFTACLIRALLPGQRRVLELEILHREFALKQEDVVNALYIFFQEDRAGVFKLKEQHDAVMERVRFALQHSDLHAMDHEVLEAAAMVSTRLSGLAQHFSTEKVAAAWKSLDVAQQQSALLEQTITELQNSQPELRRLEQTLSLKAATQQSQLQMLTDKLAGVVEQVDSEAAAALRANMERTVVPFTPSHR